MQVVNRNTLFSFLSFSSQETWTKACFTAADFVQNCGKQAISVMERMEESSKISGYTFKPLEGICVPEDWMRVGALMEMPEHKCTVNRLRDVAVMVIRDRIW